MIRLSLALGLLPWTMAMVSLPLLPLWPNGSTAPEVAHVKQQDQLPFADRLALTEPRLPMDRPPIAQRRALVRYLAETPDGTITDVPVVVREPPPDLDHVYFAPPTYPIGRHLEPHITILKTVPVGTPTSHGILRPLPVQAPPAEPATSPTKSNPPLDICARHHLHRVGSGRSWHCSRR